MITFFFLSAFKSFIDRCLSAAFKVPHSFPHNFPQKKEEENPKNPET